MKRIFAVLCILIGFASFAQQGVPGDFRVGRNLTVNGFINTNFRADGWQTVTDNGYTSDSAFAITEGDTSVIPNNAGVSVTTQVPTFKLGFYNSPDIYARAGDLLSITVTFNAVNDSASGANAYLYLTAGASTYLRRVKLDDLNTTAKSYTFNFTVPVTSAIESSDLQFRLWSILGDTDVWGVSYVVAQLYQGR